MPIFACTLDLIDFLKDFFNRPVFYLPCIFTTFKLIQLAAKKMIQLFNLIIMNCKAILKNAARSVEKSQQGTDRKFKKLSTIV